MRQGVAVAATAALGLTLAACSDGDDTAGDGGDGDGGGDKTITLGYIPSWTDGLSTAYLLDHFLDEAGYTVEHEEISDAGLLYTALSRGDVDIYPSAWPEVTHAKYMDQYGDQIEDLDTYYDNAKLTFAVPEYTDIDSIDELADNVDMFDGKIVGIEPGAGLTDITKDAVIPDYGLDEAGYELVESSTTAMLTELEKATENQEDILVTLWRPFWANSAYPVKDLEDPKGALGEAEGLHFLGTEGISEEYPDVADWIGQIALDDEQYGALEDQVVNQHPDDPAAGVDAWLEEYPDVVPALEG
ncbi:glycine betaine ABC transporter substrate-binding protein [Cellulosimicrobium arenosum]|uniref:Glycine betaine ABC transporter substrate-binding protein n=2 Tax=Cellulosimicrobium arenosum TaxID=2708133 RepID=A0A927PH72_9MICO|nr:glycine betaine ABC transporter substrate-binding protein [Cellulosimicrobium arenosum]MBD8080734.1 glycine betaine ABC transporter substrate-binding protein [Cellulosimicrobium arenosum]